MPNLRIQRYIYQYTVQKPRVNHFLNRFGDAINYFANPIGFQYKTGRIRKQAVQAIENYERAKEKSNALAVLRENGFALDSMPEHLKNDREVVLAAVKQKGIALQFASVALRGDKEIVLAAIKQRGAALQFASVALRGDKEVVLAAVKREGWALQYAAEKLRGDKKIILEALKRFGRALQHASEALRDDKEVVLAALKREGTALEFASESLKGDREIVLAAVKQDGTALKFAAEALKGDKKVVLAVVKKNGYALQYASEILRRDKEVVLAAVSQAGRVLQHALYALRGNKEVVIAAVRNDVDALEFAWEALKADKEVILAATHNKGESFKYAADILKNDPAFLRAVFENNIHAYKFLPNSEVFKEEYEGLIHDLKELDIEFPTRFKELHVVKEIIENRRNPHRTDGRPLAILVYPKKDWGRVFEINQMEALIDKGYRILYFEAREEQQVYRALKENTKNQKIDLFVLAGHGVRERTSLGAEDPAGRKGEREELYIDISDEAEMIAMGLSECMAQDSVIILYSCSTGEGRRERLNVANLMKKVFPQATVFAPTEPTIILGYIYDKNGKVIYVVYSCGKDKTFVI